jgi:Ca2+-binding RTX toxin-like protein/uncharacterized membrane-anchored protein
MAPGNTLGTAFNIGNLTGIKNFNEFVGTVEPLDYYKFSLTSVNDIKLLLTGTTQNFLDAIIYQDKNNNGFIEAGEELYSDTFISTSRNGEINTTLGIGTYFVKIGQTNGYANTNSNYSLQLSATAAPGSVGVDPGNTLGTAYNIGNLTGIKNFNEFVGNGDPLDYYKFSLTSVNDIKLLLTGTTQNFLDAIIYQDKNNNGFIEAGEELYSDTFISTSRNGEINTTLGIGTYFVKIGQTNGYVNTNSKYALQLSATAAPGSVGVDPGNTLGTAYNIGNLTGIKNFNEFVGNGDPLDYYKFSLTSANDIKLVLSGINQNFLDAKIYQDKNNNGFIETGEELYSDTFISTSTNGEINQTLGAGTYYVGISRTSGYDNTNTKYALQLINTTVPNPVNTVTLAVSPSTVTEDGTNNLVYTFTRTGPTASALIVKYKATATATFNTDYTALGVTNFNGTTGTITFAAGANTATLVLDPKADTIVEANETVALTLVADTAYTIGTAPAVVGTITNDDVSSVSLSIQDIKVVEGQYTNALITVSLSAVSTQSITISYTTTPVNATVGTDYTAKTGTLIIPANTLSATIRIPILNDNLNEADESFLVTLSNPINATIDPDAGIAEVTITDTLRSAITRILPSGVENLTLTGAGVINGTGNAGNNLITGNIANNQLRGGAGNDTIDGAAGNDVFIIDADIDTGLDTLIEAVGGGTDTIDFRTTTAAVTINLATTAIQTVAVGVQLVMPILQIEDVYGGTGNDILTGNSLNNNLVGGVGNDSITGAVGNDTLRGDAGFDRFLFNGGALTGANTVSTLLGRDTIADFAVGVDKIVLSKSTFSAITSAVGGAIGANFIKVANDGLVATQAAAIVYSQGSGNLFYNQNGIATGLGANGGNFAFLTGLPTNLAATDFVIG